MGDERAHQQVDQFYYISGLHSRRNPDLLTPCGALKGNSYIRRHISLTEQPASV